MQRSGTDLDFDRAEVLTHIVGRSLGTRGKPCGLLFLFDAQSGSRFGKMVALELAQQGQDFVIGKQGRAAVNNLLPDACQQAIGVQDVGAGKPPSQATIRTRA